MSWELSIRNIAGIRSGTATLEAGVNGVRATNFQGKSSFVTAIETVIGTERTLTEGEERGHVELSTEEETYTVELSREGETIQQQGNPYLSTQKEQTVASLYAFLDDTNEVRKAVRNHENLESVLLRPLEFEDIDEQIAELTAERNRVETELERAEEAAQKLPTVQSAVHQLEDDLEDLEETRESIQEGVSNGEAIGTQRDQLSELKTERDSVDDRIERLERTIDRTREKLEEKRAALVELSVPESDEDLESKIAEDEQELTKLERDAELLQSVYAPTKRIIDEDRIDLLTDIDHNLMADNIICWQCGSDTTSEDIEAQLEHISEKITNLRAQANERKSMIEELQKKRDEIEQKIRRKSDLKADIADLESTLEDRETSLESALERRETLAEQIENMSEDVEAKGDKLTDVESDIKFTKTKLQEKRKELEQLEQRADQREVLEDEYETLTDEIADLRNRKEQIKRRTRDAFDEAIRDILSTFDVGFEMVRLTSTYDLVVAREGREADLSALSEGELELLGIVAALAGYEAFDVTDTIPIMLLDSIGELADDNIQTLIEYLSSRVERLVFTTYPENTPFEENTIEPGEWTVVSPDIEAT